MPRRICLTSVTSPTPPRARNCLNGRARGRARSEDRLLAELGAQRVLDSARLLWARYVARNRSDLVRIRIAAAASLSVHQG
jgi:hypothetical protein